MIMPAANTQDKRSQGTHQEQGLPHLFYMHSYINVSYNKACEMLQETAESLIFTSNNNLSYAELLMSISDKVCCQTLSYGIGFEHQRYSVCTRARSRLSAVTRPWPSTKLLYVQPVGPYPWRGNVDWRVWLRAKKMKISAVL